MDSASDRASLAIDAELSSSTASDASFALANKWVATCIWDHVRCVRSSESGSYYPTQVVEITQGIPELRIRSTNSDPPEGPYMTLSHRWGNAVIIKLTTSNLENLQEGFAPSELPKSFGDATAIARKFRVKYPWIDFLCIIQDSVVDWRHEAAYMGDIYRNSFCNISATGASNSELGCFAERDPSMVLPCTIMSASTNTTNQMYHVVGSRFWDHVVEAPLNRRS